MSKPGLGSIDLTIVRCRNGPVGHVEGRSAMQGSGNEMGPLQRHGEAGDRKNEGRGKKKARSALSVGGFKLQVHHAGYRQRHRRVSGS